MKVTLTQHLVGPNADHKPGSVLDLDKPTALRYCEKGIAVPWRAEDTEYALGDEPAERAVTRTGKPVHIGGGWYQLPGGAKVKGKEAAEEAMKGDG